MVERTHSRGGPAPRREPVPLLAAYDAGVTAVCQLAARYGEAGWAAPTPCPEWRAADLAGHLRCIADDFHEYLDEAPVSRYARLMATGARPEALARQNAAGLAALAEASPAEHIAAFEASARRYRSRLMPVWELPHHQYRGIVVTVGGMAGAVCAEWHLHAWDLAMSLGADYRPADPATVLAGWMAGLPQLPVAAPGGLAGIRGWRPADPWQAVLAASGRAVPRCRCRELPSLAWPGRPGRRHQIWPGRPGRRHQIRKG
jgi:uncharacterized protein (TIGR03083 family)